MNANRADTFAVCAVCLSSKNRVLGRKGAVDSGAASKEVINVMESPELDKHPTLFLDQ